MRHRREASGKMRRGAILYNIDNDKEQDQPPIGTSTDKRIPNHLLDRFLIVYQLAISSLPPFPCYHDPCTLAVSSGCPAKERFRA